jgi:hypothetical protein
MGYSITDLENLNDGSQNSMISQLQQEKSGFDKRTLFKFNEQKMGFQKFAWMIIP